MLVTLPVVRDASEKALNRYVDVQQKNNLLGTEAPEIISMQWSGTKRLYYILWNPIYQVPLQEMENVEVRALNSKMSTPNLELERKIAE